MKRTLTFALVVLFILAATSVYAGLAGKKICVDPGHGGSDPGACGHGLQEKTVNLQICNKLYNKLIADGASCKRTRSTDVYVSLQGRCDISNNWGANRFVCSHCNAFDGSAHGTETYCYSGGSSNSYDLRNKTNAEMVAHMGTTNRGVKTADFYVLIHTVAPAILCEVAFIDHAGDAAKLAQDSYRNEAARAYLHALQKHYGESPHDP